MSFVGNYNTADLVFVRTITNLHPGTGRGGEVVDLPVQRDQFEFPMIYGSSLKGAIKSYLPQSYGNLTNALLDKRSVCDFYYLLKS